MMQALKLPEYNELNALIRLVEDPDPKVFDHVRTELLSMGPKVVPVLESANRPTFDAEHQFRIHDIIREIRLGYTKSELERWRASSNRDLLKGCLIISKFQNPLIDESAVEAEINKLKQKVWLEINEENTAFEIVKIFNHVLFDQCGFRSSRSNFYSPQNSCLDTVLETRVGNPLSLSIIYSVIAQKLHIPIYGVNLPNHFVLGYVDEHRTLKMLGLEEDRNILFYINPFSKGRIFDHSEIENYLRSLGLPAQKDYFEPCSNTDILRRILTNLSYACGKENDFTRVEELKEIQSVLI